MTLNDLATRLKASTATISPALSKPEAVATDTRKRVLEGVRRYGYQLNGIARSLRTQQTRTIGIIVHDIRNPFFSALREQKIRIPDEISLVGFGDARWAQFSDPPLAIVAQPTSAMGKRSAELLLARIQKEKGTATEIFPPELVVRGSTAPPR